MKTAGMNAGERLLPIEEMEPWAQSAFKGFKYAAHPFSPMDSFFPNKFQKAVCVSVSPASILNGRKVMKCKNTLYTLEL